MSLFVISEHSPRINAQFQVKLKKSEEEKTYIFKTIEDMEKYLDEMD